jgi:hypothetical protein
MIDEERQKLCDRLRSSGGPLFRLYGAHNKAWQAPRVPALGAPARIRNLA